MKDHQQNDSSRITRYAAGAQNMQKTLPPHWEEGHLLHGTTRSILALAGGLCFLLALHAGLFVMLALANLLDDAAAGTLALKPLQSAFQGLTVTNTDLGHLFSLLSLISP